MSDALCFSVYIIGQARRQEGFEGVRSNPPFRPPKDFICTTALYILSALPFEVGPVASPPSKQPARNARKAVYAAVIKERAYINGYFRRSRLHQWSS